MHKLFLDKYKLTFFKNVHKDRPKQGTTVRIRVLGGNRPSGLALLPIPKMPCLLLTQVDYTVIQSHVYMFYRFDFNVFAKVPTTSPLEPDYTSATLHKTDCTVGISLRVKKSLKSI